MPRALRVAVVGAGPAGIYAADSLVKKDSGALVDIFDRLPTPYGLIRYGVAPDHPRIRQIVVALHDVLRHDRIRFVGNVNLGIDIKIEELRQSYDAIILATSAENDRLLGIPGESLQGCHSGSEFISFYNSHPDRPQRWDLSAAKSVAVIGAGNVALDIARMLARTADALSTTEIPQHVRDVWTQSAVTDVHVFARRGPAQAKFSPVELRQLDHRPGVEVLVAPQGMEFDEGSQRALGQSKSLRMVVDILCDWAMRDPDPNSARRIHLHFLERPVEICGVDGSVVGLRTERQQLAGDGSGSDTRQFTNWAVGAVYRAVGYRSEAIEDLPFDAAKGVLPNVGGRVLDLDGRHLPGTYTTGWIKRGPVGLIGHTKSDAAETVENLLADMIGMTRAAPGDQRTIDALLADRGVIRTDFAGWSRLDAHERAAGERLGRERAKVASRALMTEIAASPRARRGS
jgi:ferredoxin--NADP+ reductase